MRLPATPAAVTNFCVPDSALEHVWVKPLPVTVNCLADVQLYLKQPNSEIEGVASVVYFTFDLKQRLPSPSKLVLERSAFMPPVLFRQSSLTSASL